MRGLLLGEAHRQHAERRDRHQPSPTHRLADLQADPQQPRIEPVLRAARRELALGPRNGAPPGQQGGQPRNHRDRQEDASQREAGGQRIETPRQKNKGRQQPKADCDRG